METITPQTVSPIKRTVGVEIECFFPNGMDGETDENLRDIGLDIGSDSSISGQGDGYELRTRPVRGTAAEDTLKVAGSILISGGAKVNSSCGLHVHADASELDVRNYIRKYRGAIAAGESLYYVPKKYVQEIGDDYLFFAACMDAITKREKLAAIGPAGKGILVRDWSHNVRPREAVRVGPSEARNMYVMVVKEDANLRTKLHNAMQFFAAIDPILRSLISASRRHNNYCHSFTKMTRNGGRLPETLTEMLQGISGRYCGINMASLYAHGTIENRYHSGTVNGMKMLHWARMWARCIDVAVSKDAESEADALSETINSKNRLEMFVALLNLPEDTQKYLLERHKAFAGSDARRSISYVANKKLVCAV